MGDSSLWAEGQLGKAGGRPQIIFAQVREDAAVELELLQARPAGETAFCIASGGCTAFSLLAARPQRLHVVDINPAQIFLIEAKKAAMQHLPRRQMLTALLYDAGPAYFSLRPHLSIEAQRFWDENPHLLVKGFNQCGIIEQRLKQVMRLLSLVQSRRDVRRLFSARNLEAQRKIYNDCWDHWRWKLAFDVVLSKLVLSVVYGRDFVRAVPPGFAGQVKLRVDEAFLSHPLPENGYLWQTFLGRYPRVEAALPVYLQPANYEVVREEMKNLQPVCADAARYLEAQAPGSIGFFALSNILEVTTSAYAERLLTAVGRAARQGARVCVRSIFPFDDLLTRQAAYAGLFQLASSPAASLQKKDRSFLCTNIRVFEVVQN